MSDGRLQGKVALVTGGASGIGAATVRRFRQEGAEVVIADVQTDLGNKLESETGAVFQQHDVTNEAQWKDLMAMVAKRFGRLDVMFNNAGVGRRQVNHRYGHGDLATCNGDQPDWRDVGLPARDNADAKKSWGLVWLHHQYRVDHVLCRPRQRSCVLHHQGRRADSHQVRRRVVRALQDQYPLQFHSSRPDRDADFCAGSAAGYRSRTGDGSGWQHGADGSYGQARRGGCAGDVSRLG